MVKAGGGCYFLLLLLTWAGLSVPTLALAQESDNSKQDSETPSLEMLEFLGGWQDTDGDVEDPLYWKEFFEEDVVIPQPMESEDDER